MIVRNQMDPYRSVTLRVYKCNRMDPNGSIWFHLYTFQSKINIDLLFKFGSEDAIGDRNAIEWGSAAHNACKTVGEGGSTG